MTMTIREIGWRGIFRAVVGVAVLAALSMPAGAAPKAKAKAAAPAQPAQVRQIEILHYLPRTRAKALQNLVERFNAQSKSHQVVFVERDWRTGDIPHMLILDGDNEEAFLAGKPRFKPLSAVMKEAGVALQTLRPPAMMTRTPVGANGQLRALPAGLNTPVLYFNRDALRQAGINPDTVRFTTWGDLQKALARLAEKGSSCPYAVVEPGRVMVENLSAWHNAPVAATKGKRQQYVFNSLLQVKHIALMASWHRARLLHIFPDRAEAELRFASGECALLVAPSDSWVDFRQQDGIDVGVTRLPYYDDFSGAPQNTLADGASLWVAGGKKAAEYKGVAAFIKFWLQPDNQIAWQRETGYLPLNRAGILASESALLGDDLENIRVAVGQLTNKSTTGNSFAHPVVGSKKARLILDEELSGVWANGKAAKAALDNAVLRISSETR
ncbi:MAG: extracellular solute-binding protein [Azoarcus sp.]|jgi:sn-glycerol 3-phosphate transport system substrate-binding protein|nr:extracellular solute-binding protein [Azoarcus sp.]